MPDSEGTRPSLLIRVRDAGDSEAWQEFAAIYTPLIYRFARRRRLQDADVADLAQAVLGEVSQAVRRLDYDPRRGSFRGWLFRVVRNQFSKWRTRRRRGPVGSGDPAVEEALLGQPDREDEEAVWNREYQQQLFRWAAERVRVCFEDLSWQAFWRTAVEGQSPGEAAAALGLSLGAVYTAKSRILDRIRREIRQIQGD
jgi:RNA polymerase sigma-70 factor (ECF subfamily)